LAAVSYLKIYPQQTSILLTWTPPFSLDITGVDPDLWYCVEVFNVTAGRTLFTTNCSVYEPEFEFTVPNPSPCDKFEFRVIPVNGAGNGNVTTINGTLFEGKLLMSVYTHWTVYRHCDFHLCCFTQFS